MNSKLIDSTKIINSSKLTDSHGRTLHKLRVQLTDACNFRCLYCMPLNAKFLPPDFLMSPEEIEEIVSHLVDFGVDELRLTGGEPTIRREFVDIVTRLNKLPVQKYGLTTNGYTLGRFLDFLRETKLRHINISLDSLQQDRFEQITRTKKFKPVMDSILKAHEMGFNVKLNVVLLRGKNDDEVLDFVRFSEDTGIEVRFLEYMAIGPQYKETSHMFISAEEVILKIKSERNLNFLQMPTDSTSFNFVTEKNGNIGFIASESKPFCMQCSRLRLTATGHLRACLMSDKGVSLRGVEKKRYAQLLGVAMGYKPTGRIESISQPMHQIGG